MKVELKLNYSSGLFRLGSWVVAPVFSFKFNIMTLNWLDFCILLDISLIIAITTLEYIGK